MKPHKSRKYRAILDLSSVNEATKETEPAEVIEQVGTVIPRIIKALAIALLLEDRIYFSKLDIKYGFCIMVFEVEEEWNFAYVMTNHLEAPNKLVIPSAL